MEIVKFTPGALAAIERYRKTLMIPETHYLRIGIRQKNETNKRLLIGFDEKSDKDQAAVINGLQVIYAPGEVFFFAGMVIDFVEQDGKSGFTFTENVMNK
jgi:Fe-S cluster assembly iron-binding protein IscA